MAANGKLEMGKRNHKPLGHFVKHFAPTIQKPAFHIHINHGIAIIQIRSKPTNQNRLRMNLQCLVTRRRTLKARRDLPWFKDRFPTFVKTSLTFSSVKPKIHRTQPSLQLLFCQTQVKIHRTLDDRLLLYF
jgi:hypothetical protein